MRQSKEHVGKLLIRTRGIGIRNCMISMALLTVCLLIVGTGMANMAPPDITPPDRGEIGISGGRSIAAQSQKNASASTLAEITSLWPVSNAMPGATSRLWANVVNTSTSALPANAQVGFYVYGPEIDKFVGYASVAGLAVGAAKWVYFDWAIPAAASPDIYSYWAVVLQGSTEISNWSDPQDFTIGIHAKVTNLYPVSNTLPGKTSILWADVKNTGSAALPVNALVWFYVRGPGIDKFVGSVSASGLAAGASEWFEDRKSVV